MLITGESGTGKELVARNIHVASRRAQAALVSFNCPALSPQLMESELFGHERGAFTGADAPRVGRFELADQGTVLLDEITEIELPLQAKLLRVLQEQSFERVGSSVTQHVDVRVLVTTNRDLYAEVKAGRFRQDLYFRLAVVPIQVPAAAATPRGHPAARRTFPRARRTAARTARTARRIRGALDLLVNHHWPGNVRELENIITRASVLCGQEPVTADQLRPWLIDSPAFLPDGCRGVRGRRGHRGRHESAGDGAAADRNDIGALSRPPREDRQSAGDRHSHLGQQTTQLRLCAPREIVHPRARLKECHGRTDTGRPADTAGRHRIACRSGSPSAQACAGRPSVHGRPLPDIHKPRQCDGAYPRDVKRRSPQHESDRGMAVAWRIALADFHHLPPACTPAVSTCR